MTDQPKHLRIRIAEFWNRIIAATDEAGPTAGPWRQRAAFGGFRRLRGVIADLRDGQLTLWAMSLVYTTLLSLVPLLAISFSVLKGFGVHNQIEPFLLDMLAPLGHEQAGEVTSQIITFVDNTSVSVLGFVGFGVLFYTAVSMMQKIEHAFNYVWHTTEERTFIQRVRDYLSVIIIGPTLLFASIGAIASILSTPALEGVAAIKPIGWLIETFSKLVPTLLVIAAFTFIYSFVPNTVVRLRSAFIGALVAGGLWNAMGWFFAAFIASSSNYMTIYAGFATPVLFMLWLYFSWLVLLLGASISFYDQHPEYALKGRKAGDISIRIKEKLSLLVAAAVGRNFYAAEAPLGTGGLAQALRAPVPAVEKVVGILEKCGFLRRTGDDPPCFVPARPWETVTAAEMLAEIRAYTELAHMPGRGLAPHSATDGLFDSAERALAQTLGQTTLKDLALSGAEPRRPRLTETRTAPAE